MPAPDGLVVTPKAPSDVVDYTVVYKGLVTDTLNSLGTSASGITVAGSPAPSYTDDTVTFWVSGGTVDTYGTVTLTVTTAGGRTFVRVIVIPIETL